MVYMNTVLENMAKQITPLANCLALMTIKSIIIFKSVTCMHL